MSIRIMLGGIRFQLESDFELFVERSVEPFLCDDCKESDIKLYWFCKKETDVKPQGKKAGEDLLLEYYIQEDQILCMAKGGEGTYLSTAICKKRFKEVECYLHFKPQEKMRYVGNLLRLIPMCEIFKQQKVLFFHSSQIEVAQKGILFTAFSGTGKTTQAKLWSKYRNTRIICNDRTMIRNGKTYGYPIDGSEPVCSKEVLNLGAIILLEQGMEDSIVRIQPKEAVKMLYPQIIGVHWNTEIQILFWETLISLVESYPVYLLKCTPKESAVQCLERQLIMDGVIKNAENKRTIN